MKVKVSQVCPTLCDPYSPWNSPGQSTGVGSLSLLQGIFPTQGSNPGLPHRRPSLYQLSHKGSPRILEWVAYPFFRGSSQPRNRTGVFCIAGRFFTNWAIREAQLPLVILVTVLIGLLNFRSCAKTLYVLSHVILTTALVWWIILPSSPILQTKELRLRAVR